MKHNTILGRFYFWFSYHKAVTWKAQRSLRTSPKAAACPLALESENLR